MRARIIRRIGTKDEKIESACVMCGDNDRKNKGRYEVELPCGYKAEVKICRPCSGEHGVTRTDMIEVPFLGNDKPYPWHFHLEDHVHRTFWDYADALAWVKQFMQTPTPVEDPQGVWTIKIHQDFRIHLCKGEPKTKVQREEMSNAVAT